jgi:hypothetical protein
LIDLIVHLTYAQSHRLLKKLSVGCKLLVKSLIDQSVTCRIGMIVVFGCANSSLVFSPNSNSGKI